MQQCCNLNIYENSEFFKEENVHEKLARAVMRPNIVISWL